MASVSEVGECLRVHLNDVVRFVESGNHDCDTLDYTIFRLDWVLNVLARYLDTEGTGAINARVIDLVCEAREAVINADHSRGAFQAGCIFTGQPGRPKLNVPQEQLQFLIERRFNTTQIASKALLVQICHFVVWIFFMLLCTSCCKEIVDEQYDINVNRNTYFKIIEKINIQPCLLLFSLEQPPKRGVWQDIFHFLWGIWSLKDINIGCCSLT